MASIGKPKVQCRFCDSECVILLKSYNQHLRRKHNGVYLTAAEKREDVVSGGENLRRPNPNGDQAASQRYDLRNSKRHASASDNFIERGNDSNDDEEAPRSPESASSNDGGASSSTDDEFFDFSATKFNIEYPNEEYSWISPTWIVGPSARVRFLFSQLQLIFSSRDFSAVCCRRIHMNRSFAPPN